MINRLEEFCQVYFDKLNIVYHIPVMIIKTKCKKNVIKTDNIMIKCQDTQVHKTLHEKRTELTPNNGQIHYNI